MSEQGDIITVIDGDDLFKKKPANVRYRGLIRYTLKRTIGDSEYEAHAWYPKITANIEGKDFYKFVIDWLEEKIAVAISGGRGDESE